MDIAKEISNLERKGIFICLNYDHYPDGTNCNFSIQFTKTKNQTCWYGDNHEFGGTAETLIAAISFAKWFSEDDERIKWFFFNAKRERAQAPDCDAHENWIKSREMAELAGAYIGGFMLVR